MNLYHFTRLANVEAIKRDGLEPRYIASRAGGMAAEPISIAALDHELRLSIFPNLLGFGLFNSKSRSFSDLDLLGRVR